jgi:D-aminopeptidase
VKVFISVDMEGVSGITDNGEPTGETPLNAAYAGHSGVPVGMQVGHKAIYG